jgi:exopolysaccharide biosynthesis polyprenyl glycosylphosphotransferase
MVATVKSFGASSRVVLLSKALGLYDRDEHLLSKTTLDEAPKLFTVATMLALLTWLAGGLAVSGDLGRSQVLLLWVVAFLALCLGRVLARRLVRSIAPAERCLILGNPAVARFVEGKLASSRSVDASVVARVPLVDAGLDELVSRLPTEIVVHDVDRVVVAPGRSDSPLELVRAIKSLGVKVSVVPQLLEVVGSSVEFDEVEGLTLLGVRRYGLSRSSEALKRGMDVVGAAAALLLLAPLLSMIALAVRLDSPGPLLFRQRRVGRHGRPFQMLKFRTMADGAEGQRDALAGRNEASGGLFKIADDPRVTRVGRFLRGTSLDELPQLFNVLRGEMSLVGPRPLVVDEDRRVEGWQRERSRIPPGMTGLWQVFGSARIPLPEMVKIDYLYATNWSLWLDVKILLRTLPHVLARRGM